MRRVRLLTAGLLVLSATACVDALNVDNTNSPDGDRALNRPGDVEALIGSSYQAVHSAQWGGSDAIETQAIVMSLESFSNLANFGFNLRSAIPRSSVDNGRNNAANAGNYRDYLNMHRAARQAAVGLSKVNDPNFTFFPANAAQKLRARAMGHFAIGAALGNVALIYEQGTIIGPNDPPSSTSPPPLPLTSYDTLMTYALAELDSAVALATAAGAAQATIFPTPAGWFGANTAAGMTQAQFIGFARAYKARFRAGVARTPAERAAVNWALVIADAQAGAAAWPANVNLQMNTSLGWSMAWIGQSFASNSNNWHMTAMFMMGMADSSGAYDPWLAAQNSGKVPFLVVSADRRFPQGLTRAAQQATGGNQTSNPTVPAGQYFRNRSVSDWVGDPWANTWYDHFRHRPYFNTASSAVLMPVFTTAEMNLLAAEGYYRTGAFDQAAALINISRVAVGQLPPFPAAGNTAATVVPGSASGCVPRVPQPPSFNSAACGTLFEALKWEKRMETQFSAPYAWYLDSRGWGDLPEGTALYWAVPYQEIDTRQLMASPPAYTPNVGGIGAPNGAAVSTYGPISKP